MIITGVLVHQTQNTIGRYPPLGAGPGVICPAALPLAWSCIVTNIVAAFVSGKPVNALVMHTLR